MMIASLDHDIEALVQISFHIYWMHMDVKWQFIMSKTKQRLFNQHAYYQSYHTNHNNFLTVGSDKIKCKILFGPQIRLSLFLSFWSFCFMGLSSCPRWEVKNDMFNANSYTFEACFDKDVGGFGSKAV